MKKWIVIVGVVAVVITAGIGYYFSNDDGNKTASVSVLSSISEQVSKTEFSVYAFGDSAPNNYTIESNTVTYSEGILLYNIKSPNGQVVSITQQKLPPNLSTSTIQGDESFDTAHGRATFAQTSEGRLTGSLLTKDGTLVLINTIYPVEESIFKDVLRFLEPLD